ncbi:MAG: tyrosine-type recombinase/integrase [Arhodomonas sp.]|nr:tyrosine-type recombinase/integrase [Arhodomonas sp.]
MASVHEERPGYWVIRWREEGRSRKRALGRVTAAEAEAARVAKERELAGFRSAAGPRLRDWAVTYAEWHSAEYPDSYYRVYQIFQDHLLPAFGDLALMAIDRTAVEAYKRARLAKVAPATVAKEIRTLKAALNAAVEWETIPSHRIQHVKAPRSLTDAPPRWYTRDELQAIYAAELDIHQFAQWSREQHHTYRWAWQLLANTGMRRTEAVQLDRRDIGAEAIRIVSAQGARTKSGKWRQVPITPGAREALESLPKKGRVMPGIHPDSISRAFRRTARAAGLDGHVHNLRHTYASHLVMGGVPLRTVQVLLGHAHYATTERYAYLAPDYLADAGRGLHL